MKGHSVVKLTVLGCGQRSYSYFYYTGTSESVRNLILSLNECVSRLPVQTSNLHSKNVFEPDREAGRSQGAAMNALAVNHHSS